MSKNSRKHKQRIKTYLNNIKAKGCSHCGYATCLSAIEFHHVEADAKVKDLSRLESLVMIRIELRKCVVLCANCHREVHEQIVDVSGLRRAIHCDVLQFKLFK